MSQEEAFGLTLIQGVGQELVPEGLVQAAVRPTGAKEHVCYRLEHKQHYVRGRLPACNASINIKIRVY